MLAGLELELAGLEFELAGLEFELTVLEFGLAGLELELAGLEFLLMLALLPFAAGADEWLAACEFEATDRFDVEAGARASFGETAGAL